MKKIVIAIGNGGCNIATNISMQPYVKDVTFVYCDLVEHDPASHGTNNDFHLAPNDIDKICEIVNLSCNDLILIVSCLGGKVGSTFAPIIAEKMAASGATVAAFVSIPLRLEGKHRLQVAQEAQDRLRKCCKMLIVQNNEELSELTAFDSINDTLCRQATVMLSMNQADRQRITNPNGVKNLMQSLWLNHQMKLPINDNNLFWVDFEPEQNDTTIHKDWGNSRFTVKQLLEGVKFDDLVDSLCSSDVVKRNLIIIKDAFDFLRDQKILVHKTGMLKFLSKNNRGSEEFSIEPIEVSTPEEFVSLTIELEDSIDATPEMLVIKLLRHITSEGKESVYHYFRPDGKASEMFADFFHEMRRQQKWRYRVFTSSKKKAADKEALNRLQDFAMARSLKTQCVGDSWASNPFPCMDESWVVKEIRSHISEDIAEDYIIHLLSNYDFEDYSKYSQKIINIWSSDRDKLRRITPFLNKHFQTEAVGGFSKGNGGIMMTIILIP